MKRNLIGKIAAICLLLAGIIVIIGMFCGNRYERTDDAQVEQYISPVNVKVAGYIREIHFTEHQHVNKGDTLIIIDDRDFTLSPDGTTICFTEWRSGHYGIYLVDAERGNVVRQVSNGTDNDYAGQITKDNNTIFFHRGEGYNTYSLWSWDRKNNLFSNYSRGMSPVLDPRDKDVIYCARFTDKKESEIWRLNLSTGVEELILGLPGRSFTTPQLSPDGNWLLVTGTAQAEKAKRLNTDIFAVRTDGTQLTQLTYHPGNDLSAIWAPDGHSIYFLSERGTAGKVYNVWKMDFNL